MSVPNLALHVRERNTPPPNVETHPLSTVLASWPDTANLTVWTIQAGSGAVLPVRRDTTPVHKLIMDGTTVIIGFHDIMDWDTIQQQLDRARELDLPAILLIATSVQNALAAALFGAGERALQHGLSAFNGERVICTPSDHLLRLLRLRTGSDMPNNLILIHNGQLKVTWVASDKHAEHPHEWTTIVQALTKMRDDENPETDQ